MNQYEAWVLKDAAQKSGLDRLMNSGLPSVPPEMLKFAEIIAQHERDACASAKAPCTHKLAPCGTGAFLSDQQYCFEKGWKMGAAAVRKQISRRTGIDGKKK